MSDAWAIDTFNRRLEFTAIKHINSLRPQYVRYRFFRFVSNWYTLTRSEDVFNKAIFPKLVCVPLLSLNRWLWNQNKNLHFMPSIVVIGYSMLVPHFYSTDHITILKHKTFHRTMPRLYLISFESSYWSKQHSSGRLFFVVINQNRSALGRAQSMFTYFDGGCVGVSGIGLAIFVNNPIINLVSRPS